MPISQPDVGLIRAHGDIKWQIPFEAPIDFGVRLETQSDDFAPFQAVERGLSIGAQNGQSHEVVQVDVAVIFDIETYGKYVEGTLPSGAGETELPGGLGVNEVLYSLMSDADRLSELTKLVGKLRVAIDGGEDALATEAESDINLLVSHLPENHKATRLIESVRAEGATGARLAELYLQRCFHLIREDYVKLGEVEDEINTLEKEGPSSEV